VRRLTPPDRPSHFSDVPLGAFNPIWGTLRTRPVSAHPGLADKTGDFRTSDAAAKGGAVRTAGPTTGRGRCRG